MWCREVHFLLLIKKELVQPMGNYAMAYPQQPGMVGLPTAIPGTQSDLTAYAPMQPGSYAFGGQQFSVPYQGQMMGHQGQAYPSPLAPSLIGMNTAQAAAAAVRTSVGPQTEGMLSLFDHNLSCFARGILVSAKFAKLLYEW